MIRLVNMVGILTASLAAVIEEIYLYMHHTALLKEAEQEGGE